MSGSFADSNVLLYIVSGDDTKADIAERLLRSGLHVSVQVLNEIANVMVRKWQRPWSDALPFLDEVTVLATVHPLGLHTHKLGVEMAARHRLSVYDGIIVGAALIAECDVLYSQDMHHGLLVEDRLRIVNPFLPN